MYYLGLQLGPDGKIVPGNLMFWLATEGQSQPVYRPTPPSTTISSFPARNSQAPSSQRSQHPSKPTALPHRPTEQPGSSHPDGSSDTTHAHAALPERAHPPIYRRIFPPLTRHRPRTQPMQMAPTLTFACPSDGRNAAHPMTLLILSTIARVRQRGMTLGGDERSRESPRARSSAIGLGNAHDIDPAQYKRDYWRKIVYFRSQPAMPVIVDAKCNVRVRRGWVFEDSFTANMRLRSVDLRIRKRPIVWFESEDTLDHGDINLAHGVNPEHPDYSKSIGRAPSPAVFHHRFSNAYSVPGFYEMVPNKKVGLKDIEAVDYGSYKGLTWGERYNGARLGEMFSVTDGRPLLWAYRRRSQARRRYTRHDGGGPRGVRQPHRGASDRGAVPRIHGRDDGDRLGRLDGVQRLLQACLLQLTTGTSRVLVDAFKYSQGCDGLDRFTIEKSGHANDLPRMHMCSNYLDLDPPLYENYESERKLCFAIEETEVWARVKNGSTPLGFGNLEQSIPLRVGTGNEFYLFRLVRKDSYFPSPAFSLYVPEVSVIHLFV
ncbi:hypothetical protein BJY52DRAFT_1188306 [Lactarius psammicola]|nr:hypothetical protein BJY52DRAFT_1188306 [Lactarius psammicola]